jgi:hypothetical protein
MDKIHYCTGLERIKKLLIHYCFDGLKILENSLSNSARLDGSKEWSSFEMRKWFMN